tara:strand:- start:205 stop:480 length:276 start_codon:yes stop_codon:yes gene_type:complete
MKFQDKTYKEYCKDMQLAKKKLDTLYYVSGAILHDVGNKKLADQNFLNTAEGKKLKSRSYQLMYVDIKSAIDEYRRLLDIVYAPDVQLRFN